MEKMATKEDWMDSTKWETDGVDEDEGHKYVTFEMWRTDDERWYLLLDERNGTVTVTGMGETLVFTVPCWGRYRYRDALARAWALLGGS